MGLLKELNDFYKAQKVRKPWAVARAIVDQQDKGHSTVNPLYDEEVAATGGDEDKKRALMGKIVAGIQNNPYNKSMDDNEDVLQKINPALAGGLAGWWLGGNIQDIARGMGQPTPAQQREFERQIQQAMRQKGRKISKDSAMEKMQAFFQKDENDTYVRKTPVKNAVQADEDILQKILSIPPFAGAKLDPTSHRWTKPENFGQTYAARGGKKRIRGTGTGIGERTVSGHGKGRVRQEGAQAKYKSETHLAASRRKEGFTHGKKS